MRTLGQGHIGTQQFWNGYVNVMKMMIWVQDLQVRSVWAMDITISSNETGQVPPAEPKAEAPASPSEKKNSRQVLHHVLSSFLGSNVAILQAIACQERSSTYNSPSNSKIILIHSISQLSSLM